MLNRFEDVGEKRTRTVGSDENVDIQGIQTIKAFKNLPELIMPYRVVWNVINGTEKTRALTLGPMMRLVGGPIPISGQHVQARVEEYTIDPDQEKKSLLVILHSL